MIRVAIETATPLGTVAVARDAEILAADERGLHVSADGGVRWRQVAAWPSVPDHLRVTGLRLNLSDRAVGDVANLLF